MRKVDNDINPLIYGKIPPQAREIESAVLGAIMLERGIIDTVCEYLKVECFYVDAHQRIFKAQLQLTERNINPELLTVVEQLKRNDDLDLVGGPYYVSKLTNDVVSTANIEEHCKIIKQKYLQRELIRISGEVIGEAYDDTTDAFDLLDSTEAKIFELTNDSVKSDYVCIEELVNPAIEQVEKLMSQKETVSGVPTGFASLDRLTYGWQPTDFIILAARPSVGKTAFALNLARNAANNHIRSVPVGIFSLEMSKGQLMKRFIAAEGEIPLEKINRGKFTNDDELGQFIIASERAGSMPIFIDDDASLTMYQLRSKARKMARKHKVGLIIIDYLQLMVGDKSKFNREQQIAEISRNTKVLAKELNVPIIALSQMSRDVEKRKGEPMLSDLRESGAIEQDADVVMFMWRFDYQESEVQDESLKGQTMVKFAKHRNGQLDKIPLTAKLEFQKFYDINTPLSSWRPVENAPKF
jgi:replicative DNA helicase